MKSLLSLVLFITLIYGIPFAQNNHQEINQLDEKSIIDPVKLNTQDLKKPKSIEIKSNPQTSKPLSGDLKTDTLSTEDKVYPIKVSYGTKRSELKTEIKTVDSNKVGAVEKKHTSLDTSQGANFSDKRTYEKVEVRKEIENNGVALYLPNKNNNLPLSHANEIMTRVKNQYNIISEIKFVKKENYFKVNFSDMMITEKTDLLNEILIHFGIQNYTIIQ